MEIDREYLEERLAAIIKEGIAKLNAEFNDAAHDQIQVANLVVKTISKSAIKSVDKDPLTPYMRHYHRIAVDVEISYVEQDPTKNPLKGGFGRTLTHEDMTWK